jgi:hypothetical protein
VKVVVTPAVLMQVAERMGMERLELLDARRHDQLELFPRSA